MRTREKARESLLISLPTLAVWLEVVVIRSLDQSGVSKLVRYRR